MRLRSTNLLASLAGSLTAGLALNASAGTFSATFDDNAVPSGSAVYGSAAVDSGILKITTADRVGSDPFGSKPP